MLVCAPGTAAGQLLDLSGPEAPEAGRGRSALELAARLDRAAERIRSVDGERDGLAALRAEARASYRAALASLAELGEAQRDQGSPAVLWAMTIDAKAELIDEVIEASGDASMLSALASDFAALDLAWSSGEPVPAAVLDEQIGSALALLARATLQDTRPGVGWFAVAPAVSADEVRERSAALAELGADDSTLSALDELADQVERLRSWPTYEARGEAIADDAVEAIDALHGLPDWTPAPARQRLLADVGRAMAMPIDERRVSLRLVSRHAALLSSLGQMEEGREANRLRARAAEAIATRTTGDADALPASTLAADTIATSVSRESIREDEHIARELRPAWRRLVPLVRDVTVRARDEAMDLLVDPDRATDPGVLATVGAQRRLFEDFELLERLSERLESGLDGPPELVRLVRERLLGVAQTMADDSQREAALEMLRAFDRQLSTFARIDRDAPTAARVMGERARDLPLRQIELRDAWLRGWAVPAAAGPDDATLAELDLLARLTALLADAEAFTRPETLMTWPGFELSIRARRAIADGLTEGIDELVPDAMRGGNSVGRARSEDRITTLRGEHAAALLTGRLVRTGRDAGMSLAGPLEEVALGPPLPASWMADHRREIADVCRYAEELGRLAITTGRDDPELAQVRSLVNWRALRLLEQIERD